MRVASDEIVKVNMARDLSTSTTRNPHSGVEFREESSVLFFLYASATRNMRVEADL